MANSGDFKIGDLPFEEGERHTVRRVLRNMEDKGWLRREKKTSNIWKPGQKYEMFVSATGGNLVEAEGK